MTQGKSDPGLSTVAGTVVVVEATGGTDVDVVVVVDVVLVVVVGGAVVVVVVPGGAVDVVVVGISVVDDVVVGIDTVVVVVGSDGPSIVITLLSVKPEPSSTTSIFHLAAALRAHSRTRDRCRRRPRS
jgi:hypothetical protein